MMKYMVIDKTCETCYYAEHEEMCHLCDETFSHWKADKVTLNKIRGGKWSGSTRVMPRENKFYFWMKKNGYNKRAAARVLGVSIWSIGTRLSGTPIRCVSESIRISRITGIAPVDLMFPAEFLDRIGISRRDIIEHGALFGGMRQVDGEE